MKISRNFLLVLCSFALCAVFIPSSSWAADTIVLKWSNFFPPVHPLFKACKAWGDEIEKRSQGKVKIRYFPGGTLLKGPEMFDGVISGSTDIGLSVFGYNRGRFPAMEALALPIGYTTGKMATEVANAFYQKFKPKELDEVVVLNLHGHGGGVLHSRKPVKKLEDVAGLKIRGNAFAAKVSKALGGVPVAMPMPAAYEALQRGVVDSSFSPVESLMTWKHADVVKYTVDSTVIGYTSVFYMVMNKKKWNSLPDDIKKIIRAVDKEYTPKFAMVWDKLETAAQDFAKKKGHTFIKLSPAEAERWRKAVQPVISDYIKYANGKGLPGKAYADFVQQEVAKRK